MRNTLVLLSLLFPTLVVAQATSPFPVGDQPAVDTSWMKSFTPPLADRRAMPLILDGDYYGAFDPSASPHEMDKFLSRVPNRVAYPATQPAPEPQPFVGIALCLGAYAALRTRRRQPVIPRWLKLGRVGNALAFLITPKVLRLPRL